MLKYFPRTLFLSSLFVCILFASLSPVQAQGWGDWAQRVKAWWTQEHPQVDEAEDADDNTVYIAMLFLIVSGYYNCVE
jgi:hypothetical protein